MTFTGHVVVKSEDKDLFISICNDIVVYTPKKYSKYRGFNINKLIDDLSGCEFKLLSGGKSE